MAAFTSINNGALRYVSDYHMRIAGAESNVAIGLAKLGISAAWISRLGEDEFGHFVCNRIRSEDVDCSGVKFDSDYRTGVMFKETGVGETKVFYYRENSAASHLQPSDLDSVPFDSAKILHLTGITPVLSESCKETTMSALEMAEARKVKISFDPNIRRKLWGVIDYTPLIAAIALRSHIVSLGIEEAKILFGSTDPDEICKILFKKGRAEYVAIKNGSDGAWVADYNHMLKLSPYPCKSIEPIGAGDGFNAGLLAGLIKGKDIETAGRMGSIAGALATQTSGDIEGYPDEKEMELALKGGEITYR